MALSDSQEPFLKYASYNLHCAPAAPHFGSTGLAQTGAVHHQSHKAALGTNGKATPEKSGMQESQLAATGRGLLQHILFPLTL